MDKTCAKCRQVKSEREYYGYSDGKLMGACIDCHKSYTTNRRKSNPEVARIMRLQDKIRRARAK